MRYWHVGLILVISVAVLAGCGGGQAAPEPVDEGSSETYTSAALDTSYDGALDASSQLVLGTLKLEETVHAVTSNQATALLPLWQALQGGATAQAEVDALLKQIEGTMTAEQLDAITAMQLTQDDLQAWMQSEGLDMGGGQGRAGGGQDLSPEERATRQAERGGGEVPPEIATRRAEFEGMSEEEREALRATAQAGGGFPGGTGAGGRGGAGGRQFNILLNPLIELLTQRAAE